MMCKYLVTLCLMLAGSFARAHEYWLEPTAFLLGLDEVLSVTVKVGEDLEGRSFPFDPRAYKEALWAVPDGQVDLSTRPVRDKIRYLQPLGDGLHSLTVSSYDQTLRYEIRDELREFLRSIGQEDVLEQLIDQGIPAAGISEMYRRSSKLLVHFGTLDGEDTRKGSAREWVASENGFILFDKDNAAENQPVQIVCRSAAPEIAPYFLTMKTDAAGRVSPQLPKGSACLLNSVFIELGDDRSDLKSDWVSLYFKTAP